MNTSRIIVDFIVNVQTYFTIGTFYAERNSLKKIVKITIMEPKIKVYETTNDFSNDSNAYRANDPVYSKNNSNKDGKL